MYLTKLFIFAISYLKNFCSMDTSIISPSIIAVKTQKYIGEFIKRPARDACLCMGELPAPPAPHFVFLITL